MPSVHLYAFTRGGFGSQWQVLLGAVHERLLTLTAEDEEQELANDGCERLSGALVHSEIDGSRQGIHAPRNLVRGALIPRPCVRFGNGERLRPGRGEGKSAEADRVAILRHLPNDPREHMLAEARPVAVDLVKTTPQSVAAAENPALQVIDDAERIAVGIGNRDAKDVDGLI